MRSDLADGLHRLSVALPLEVLAFRPGHSGVRAEVGRKNSVEVEGAQRVGEAGVIPMVAIFLPGRVLLFGDHVARKRAFERAVPHRDLAGVAPLEIRAGPANSLRRGLRVSPADRSPAAALCQFSHFYFELPLSLAHVYFP
jgi:hypothetical protein